jgi:hypothetical protein
MKEELEIILEQVESMEDAFDTLRDNCYQISLSLKRIIKENVRK